MANAHRHTLFTRCVNSLSTEPAVLRCSFDALESLECHWIEHGQSWLPKVLHCRALTSVRMLTIGRIDVDANSVQSHPYTLLQGLRCLQYISLTVDRTLDLQAL